jgi:2-keto-4-pentenoate hydratase/2-oxohepta-3-ene-1,7-dioic acid hydratase in catechol pathway
MGDKQGQTMHLVAFMESGRLRIGVLDRGPGEVVDLEQVATDLPSDLLGLISMGEAVLTAVRRAYDSGRARIPLADVDLKAPIPRPARNIFCVGKNYRDHLKELGPLGTPPGAGDASIPEVPIFFTKATSTVIGPGEPILAGLDPTQSVDYEGELAVIIGRGGRGIKRSEALDHVYGFTIVNDVTSRRLQKLHNQWFLGKSIDSFCPMGPALVTRDALDDPSSLRVHTRVNEELRQDGAVADMIFPIPVLIETLSRTVTLEPGDIIATGTPAGVGMGYSPPRYLQDGDQVAVTIEPIGTLSNPVA